MENKTYRIEKEPNFENIAPLIKILVLKAQVLNELNMIDGDKNLDSKIDRLISVNKKICNEVYSERKKFTKEDQIRYEKILINRYMGELLSTPEK